MDEKFERLLRQPALRRPIRRFEPQLQGENRERISKIMAAILIIAAFSIDCFEMILEWLGIGVFGLSSLLSICASLAFFIWFKILGVSFTVSPKKFATMAVTSLLEIAPGLDALGGFVWTIGIIILVVITRSEDKGGVIGDLAGMAGSAIQGKPKV